MLELGSSIITLTMVALLFAKFWLTVGNATQYMTRDYRLENFVKLSTLPFVALLLIGQISLRMFGTQQTSRLNQWRFNK
jgi:hypothetical protein